MKTFVSYKSQQGQGLVEYALILMLVIVGVAGVLQVTGYSVRDVYCAAAEGLGANEACAQEQVYCEDDFATLDDWETNWGNFSNIDGKMCTSGWAKNYSKCSQDMANMSDYTIDLSGAELTRGNGYGVFFRGTDLDGRTDGYIVQYDPGWRGGSIIMRKWVNGSELYPFATKRLPDYDWYNESHDMKIDVSGNTFTIYLNGEEVLVGQDDTYSEGGIGLRSWNGTEICVDNLSVGELSANEGGQ
ncbi:MAG: DUF1080 domain-containing protein [Anaerolineae bacterium]|jgi:hypothetical protein|nr:DUF1080 domain-containing protein [Anaerolineae bacterium]MBT7070842.1 DUF1080 domain-containing protein [Anaerolineae bacterium]MBT7325421.1 DUF1080 domain-containing protein [Anaerolineae bacterium]